MVDGCCVVTLASHVSLPLSLNPAAVDFYPLLSGSQESDQLKTIKAALINAAKKPGLTAGTKVVGLADKAKNCWSVLSVLKPHRQTLECLLDWFQIARKFQNLRQALGAALSEALENAKWELWQAEPRNA